MQPAMTHDGVALPLAAPHAEFGVNGAALACLEWLAQCSARIVELDPNLSVDAADRIAGYLWSNERLRNMHPAGAVEFLFAHPETRQQAMAA
jgi:hypothetical protein